MEDLGLLGSAPVREAPGEAGESEGLLGDAELVGEELGPPRQPVQVPRPEHAQPVLQRPPAPYPEFN